MEQKYLNNEITSMKKKKIVIKKEKRKLKADMQLVKRN